jgi:hypothetical protein
VNAHEHINLSQQPIDLVRNVTKLFRGRIGDCKAVHRAVLGIERSHGERGMGIEPGHQDDPAAMLKQRHGPFEIGLARGIPIDFHALRREIADRRSNVVGFIIGVTTPNVKNRTLVRKG